MWEMHLGEGILVQVVGVEGEEEERIMAWRPDGRALWPPLCGDSFPEVPRAPRLPKLRLLVLPWRGAILQTLSQWGGDPQGSCRRS